jgi:aspartyl-tRNA(Asn)/glutamyl-tRNA(Gln) amidotransferase subunit A
MAVEAAQWHADRFRRYPDDYPPKVRALIESGFKTPAPRYADAKAKQVRMRNWIDFETHDLPIRLTPATDGEAVDATTTGNPVMNSPWSFIGYPTISIPFGWSENGLPLSIQLIQFENDTLGLFEPAIQLEQLLAFPRRDLPL